MKVFLTFAALVACIPPAYSAPGGPVPSYKWAVFQATAVDLGTLGGEEGVALDINDSGTIVGRSTRWNGLMRAFRFSGGTMTELQSAFADSFGTPAPMQAIAINQSGAIAGHWVNAAGRNRGLIWDAGSSNAFPMQAGFGIAISCSNHSDVYGMNDAGHVVGNVRYCDGGYYPLYEATVWSSIVARESLEPTPYDSVALDINNHGQIVGRTEGDDFMKRWHWVSGQPAPSQVIPYPPRGADFSYGGSSTLDEAPKAINDAGAVTGHVHRIELYDGYDSRFHRAFFWDGTSANAQELGTFPDGIESWGEDINESRMIAGYGDTWVSLGWPYIAFPHRAFLYHRDFGMFALPAPAFTPYNRPCRAYALNELRREWTYGAYLVQLVGSCGSATGSRAVRWDVVVGRLPVSFP